MPECYQDYGNPAYEETFPCPVCDNDPDCKTCGGTGEVDEATYKDFTDYRIDQKKDE